ncbi:MAG: hypothetical protein ACI837_000655 [Crocinitomicaceae bacterium]|jgi:hypothetical protein
MKCILSTFLILSFTFFGFSNNQNVPVDTAGFTKLKAVLVIGPVQDLTSYFIKEMNKIGDFLEQKGVVVHKFYDDAAVWEDIKAAANDANFFIYSGHGTTMGANSVSGGLCIDRTISSKTMTEGFKLHDNALVIFKSVCRGAGSSASDDSDIGIKEAVKRVTDYSGPFFTIGAASYYANNFGNGCLSFLENFFNGKTIIECHAESSGRYTIEVAKEYMHDQDKQISITSHQSTGVSTRTTYTNGEKTVEKVPSIKEYEIAYVGNPDYSINHLMK